MVVKREEEGEERRGEGKKFIEYIIALLKACFGLRDVSIDNLLLSPPLTPFRKNPHQELSLLSSSKGGWYDNILSRS